MQSLSPRSVDIYAGFEMKYTKVDTGTERKCIQESLDLKGELLSLRTKKLVF